MDATPTDPRDGEPSTGRAPGAPASGDADRPEVADRLQRLAAQLRAGRGPRGAGPSAADDGRAAELAELGGRIEWLDRKLGAALLDGEDRRAELLEAALEWLSARRAGLAGLAAESAARTAKYSPAERAWRRAAAAKRERDRRADARAAIGPTAPLAWPEAATDAAADAEQLRRALAGLDAEVARLGTWRRSLAEQGDPFGVRAEVERQLAEAAEQRTALSASPPQPASPARAEAGRRPATSPTPAAGSRGRGRG